MEAIRAERMDEAPRSAGVTTHYGVLDRRQVAELSAPGAAIGLLGGVIAGGLSPISGMSLPVTLVATRPAGGAARARGCRVRDPAGQGAAADGHAHGRAMLWAVAWPLIPRDPRARWST
jgi:hypothetical protein